MADSIFSHAAKAIEIEDIEARVAALEAAAGAEDGTESQQISPIPAVAATSASCRKSVSRDCSCTQSREYCKPFVIRPVV